MENAEFPFQFQLFECLQVAIPFGCGFRRHFDWTSVRFVAQAWAILEIDIVVAVLAYSPITASNML